MDKHLIMMPKEVTFPIVKGQQIVLWRTYSALGIMLDEFIAKGIGATTKFINYMQEDDMANVIMAKENGLWTMREYPVGDDLAIYVQVKDTTTHSPKYGSYIAWSTLVVNNKIANPHK
jgi:acyl CoA:acetate/3-ketoacid CoA transferase beta subunit